MTVSRSKLRWSGCRSRSRQQQKLRGAFADLDISLDIRLLMGRQWLKMVAPVSAAPSHSSSLPIRCTRPIHIVARLRDLRAPEAWSNVPAAATRLMDGAKLYLHLTDSPLNHASDGIAALAGLDPQVDPVAERFVEMVPQALLSA